MDGEALTAREWKGIIFLEKNPKNPIKIIHLKQPLYSWQ